MQQSTAIPTMTATETESYQQQLLSQSAATSTSPDAQDLIRFNGYYIWPEAPGAFFAVDTNFVYKGSAEASFYQVDLLISLDGKTCKRVPFTGTFDGERLIQHGSIGQPDIEAVFKRVNITNSADGTEAITATCEATIGAGGVLPSNTFKAFTYNNPIDYSLFKGTYYYPVENAQPAAVLTIGDNYQLTYDQGNTGGTLTAIEAWVYNMNMYFFYFDQGTATGRLIMGTSAAGGLVCNNMVYGPSGLAQRTTTTIANAPNSPSATPPADAVKLMQYCGYYQLQHPALSPLAFLSLQGQYSCAPGTAPVYSVSIGVSLDGETSMVFALGGEASFTGTTLTIAASVPGTTPANPEMSFTFTRESVAGSNSLVSLTGNIGTDTNITGSTYFNPVPLNAFGGVPMTNAQGENLTITSDYEISLDGTVVNSFIYVPAMYILGSAAALCELSLGTNGANGNACIVIREVLTPTGLQKQTTSVFSIPG